MAASKPASPNPTSGGSSPRPAQPPAGKSRLGRGLSSLIHVSIDDPAASVSPPAPSALEPAQPHEPTSAHAAPPLPTTAHAAPPLPTSPAGPSNAAAPPPPQHGPAHRTSSTPSDVPAISEASAGPPPEASAGGTAAGHPLRVPVAAISPNPHQPRRTFDMAELAELAQSIRSNGIIQPLVVKPLRPSGDGPRRYELIAGERRWRAAQMAGLTEVPVVLQDADGWTQAQLALVENIQRSELPALERATAYKTLLRELGLTQSELATRLGEDRSVIANHLRLLELPEAVRQMLSAGELSFGHAKLLAGVSDAAEQERLARLVVAQGLSVRNLERILLSVAAVPTSPADNARSESAKAGRAAHYAQLERTISAELGMRVQLRANKGKGKLTIHFATLEQFDELMEKLGVDVRDATD